MESDKPWCERHPVASSHPCAGDSLSLGLHVCSYECGTKTVPPWMVTVEITYKNVGRTLSRGMSTKEMFGFSCHDETSPNLGRVHQMVHLI